MLCRTFTTVERYQRDAWITTRIENDCVGCETLSHADGYDSWRPAERCPVHGVDCATWWEHLNAELDRRWPGRWEESVAP